LDDLEYAPAASSVVDRYNQMRESDKQDLMNFLRSLLTPRPRRPRQARRPARLETR
jgi:hypothetical protein